MNTSDSERIATFLEAQGFLACDEIETANLVIFNTCGVKQTAENRAYSLINNLRKAEKASRQKTKDYLPTGQAGKPKAIVMTGCLANRADVQKRMKSKVDLFCEIKNFPEAFGKLNLCHPERNFSDQNQKNEVEGSELASGCNGTRFLDFARNDNSHDYLSIIPKHQNNFQAFVPIMTGCNNFCAYCVVPNARGREVSRPAEEILSEVKDLVARGYKNIILLGQNVNSYHGAWSKEQETRNNNPAYRQAGKQISISNIQKNAEYEKLSLRECNQPGNSRALLSQSFFTPPGADRDDGKIQPTIEEKIVTFPTLLKKINSIPGKFWIQFVSSHPKDMSDELIEVIAKSEKVCENVHLPLQAGDDEVLRRMNRKYDQKHYLDLLKKIKFAFKKNKPGKLFSISSDIIVGFPGETRRQFLQSAEVMEKAKFDMVFFGQFSPRPETTAWKMKDNVSQTEKARREKYLNEILKKTAFENNLKYVGKVVEVLIEKKGVSLGTKSPAGDLVPRLPKLTYFGKTRTLKNVKIITSRKDLVGKIVKVKIVKANVWNLEGEIQGTKGIRSKKKK